MKKDNAREITNTSIKNENKIAISIARKEYKAPSFRKSLSMGVMHTGPSRHHYQHKAICAPPESSKNSIEINMLSGWIGVKKGRG
jgi:hypothetical protein